MAKNVKDAQEVAVAEAVSKTESFFEQNGKKVIIALVALVAIFVGAYLYKTNVLDVNAIKASELIVAAQDRFSAENPDYQVVLEGDENGAGLLDVIEQYGSTPAGNLAKHYAGVCYLHLGDLVNAEKYLSQYSTTSGVTGEVLNAENYGLRGDIAVENDDLDAALSLYAKAVKASDNEYTSSLYIYKQVLAYAAQGNASKAEECYNELKSKHATAFDLLRRAEEAIGVATK